jgi:hypothetical protein
MVHYSQKITACLALIAALLCSGPCLSTAQEANLARDLANPFSSVWSIANQFNFNNLRGGLFEKTHTQFNWNFQPVMPVPLNDQFNVVNRMVIPFYKSPFLDATGELQFAEGIGPIKINGFALSSETVYPSGIGDTIWASLLVPNKATGLIWGLGVTFQVPTASSTQFGHGLWQAGPAAGLFYVSDKIVAGVFPQHWHSMGGVDDRHPATRYTNLQYALAYLPTPELTISSSANILIDWTKDEANRWTVPLAIGATYLIHLGKLPVQIGGSYQWVVKHPQDIEHQESIVRLIFTPVIPSPFAKKE